MRTERVDQDLRSRVSQTRSGYHEIFYEQTLASHSGLKIVFNLTNQATGVQAQALANAVYAYACNIDDLSPVLPVVELINNKHASLLVRPEQYAVVGDQLLQAIQRVLGSAVTEDLLDAWAAAYWQLAQIMMVQEHALFQKTPAMVEWQDFIIVGKVAESEEITSFYLEPTDAELKPLPAYSAGQFISILVDVPELGVAQPRQYSISESPNDNHYRISIKKGTGARGCPAVVVSNLMHSSKNVGDVIKVSAPRGTFFTATNIDPTSAVVLISAGVGITSIHSVLSSLAGISASRPVTWIHCARTTKSRVFSSSVATLAKSQTDMQVVYFNSTTDGSDVEGVDYHFKGCIDLAKLDFKKQLYLDNPEAQYYICGPHDFMTGLIEGFRSRGVSPDRIRTQSYSASG